MTIQYYKSGDYYLPDLQLQAPELSSIGKYGRMRKQYLKEHRPILFSNLILSEKLYPHLAEINQSCIDRMELLIQKSVELGVSEIVPVLTARCVARPTKADFEKKRDRLQKIAHAAAKQSGRGIIPEIAPLHTWQEALRSMQTQDIAVMLYEEQGGVRFGEVPLAGKERIGLFIGSEGGIAEEEAAQAVEAGLYRVWLGRRILRCETAPTAAVSVLMYLTGNM